MDNPKFSPLELIALGTGVKSGLLSEAKASIEESSTGDVDFCVRVTGSIQKGTGRPGASGTHPAAVSLTSLMIFCQVLRICGIGETRLRRALQEIDPSKVTVDAKLSAIFDAVAAEKAEGMPGVPWSSNPTAGAVQSQISFTRVELPPEEPTE